MKQGGRKIEEGEGLGRKRKRKRKRKKKRGTGTIDTKVRERRGQQIFRQR